MRLSMLFLAFVATAAVAEEADRSSAARTRGFDVRDLVMLDRVSDPRLSPDGRTIAFQLRETDLEANKGVNGIWLRSVDGNAAPRRLTTKGEGSTSPRWSPDGRSVWFLSSRGGSSQVWRVEIGGGEARQVTEYPLDVGSFAVSPDGKRIAVSMEVFPDCTDLACTKSRMDERAKGKATGQLHEDLFIRHWDTWKNGTRSQLFVADLDASGHAEANPAWVTKGIDGDVPSKPFGDDADYAFSPDGESIVFAARIAGSTEPWSTNFDLYAVGVEGGRFRNLTDANDAVDTGPVFSADGRTLYWRAMKRPGFEADRYAIMAMSYPEGAAREIAPRWDRTAESIQPSADGRTIYTHAPELGQTKLFAIDAASGAVRVVAAGGTIGGYDVGERAIVFARDTLKSPAQLYRIGLDGRGEARLSDFNAQRLANVAFGDYEQFEFAGAGGETVHGYVVKPAGFDASKQYPVAFIIHGGPQGSMGDHFHYRWNPQTYAGRGYAAVFIDFHGSVGYGQAFTDSISGDWGGKPLEDLKLGLAHALETYDFLDGERVCALGASYGGYMVNWIAGNWHQPFRCLVNHDGVFDNRMMGYSTEELWFDEWEMQGTPFDEPANYEKHNPVLHVAKWEKPMLVVHGQLDYRIPVEQGIGAFTALRRRGIPAQFLYFPDENHWVLKPRNSIQWHDTVNAWLDRWTK
jgi:dipeptidyl aminopeptidase/acylaminoacyl peptidase